MTDKDIETLRIEGARIFKYASFVSLSPRWAESWWKDCAAYNLPRKEWIEVAGGNLERNEFAAVVWDVVNKHWNTKLGKALRDE